MHGILKSIFYPQDGSREQVRKEVASSREKVETAANRFEATIRNLMDRNDDLTGRAHVVYSPPRE